jgi:formylglycine-generating enzyme required for sulfatase activity
VGAGGVVALLTAVTGGVLARRTGEVASIAPVVSVPGPAPAPVTSQAPPPSASPPATTPAGSARITIRAGHIFATRDDSELVWIPAGEFQVGGDPERPTQPLRRVRLERGFYLSRCEVSWAQYRRFCDETGRPTPKDSVLVDGVEHRANARDPVFSVTFDEARAYAAWVGGRLPTSVEWECAARGPDGRRFPWGDGFPHGPGSPVVANIADAAAARTYRCTWDLVRGYDDGLPFFGPVDSCPAGASPFGCLNMAGNVAEWVEATTEHVASAGAEVRGGSWYDSDWGVRSMRGAAVQVSTRSDAIGFRIAMEER